MDQQLISLARAVKRRRRAPGATLWLFTDAARQPDVLAIIARLPRDVCGVVFRHDGAADRADLALRVAALCRARRLPLVVAGDWRLAAACRAGLHLRGGVRPRTGYRGGVTTASAHDPAQRRAAIRARVTMIFVSPAFATASHAGQRALGSCRWAALARDHATPMLALGGINGGTGRRIGRHGAGFGVIEALSSL
ncbi:thiamine phosphate synthase [Acidiphilium sp.]|uniref:thiamine phosphate synthase n=1 Tax=Acidiphilium sp. TaxID=527 RepID=UPI003CFF3390